MLYYFTAVFEKILLMTTTLNKKTFSLQLININILVHGESSFQFQ